ncbi:MAG: carbohydrate kinase family protein [Candidatus Levybacteria bacterium]|nr:carbohydrate kinase family protein [Candidatus Levybacteria bacterium]
MHYVVVTVGNALFDILLTLQDNNEYYTLHQNDQTLCIKMGEKIPAQTVTLSTGGGACRIAIALSRLSEKIAVFAAVGQDALAQSILSVLVSENVDIAHVQKILPTTSLAMGLSSQSERTLFTYHAEERPDFDFSGITTDWVYLAALGGEWERGHEQVVEFVRANNLKLAFNPGASQFAKGTKSFLPTLQKTDILFVNKQEAEKIAEKQADNMSELLKTLQNLGPKRVAITDGKRGSCGIDTDSSIYTLPIMEERVVEKTGAGDAYAAGVLFALINNKPLPTAMQWGTALAASVVGKIGGHHGLLTAAELEEMLKKPTLPKIEPLAET